MSPGWSLLPQPRPTQRSCPVTHTDIIDSRLPSAVVYESALIFAGREFQNRAALLANRPSVTEIEVKT